MIDVHPEKPLVTTCPHCHVKMNRASCVGEEDQMPGPGDWALCFECGEWCVYADATLTLRQPTEAEFLEIGETPVCQQSREAWVRMDAVRRRDKEARPSSRS